MPVAFSADHTGGQAQLVLRQVGGLPLVTHRHLWSSLLSPVAVPAVAVAAVAEPAVAEPAVAVDLPVVPATAPHFLPVHATAATAAPVAVATAHSELHHPLQLPPQPDCPSRGAAASTTNVCCGVRQRAQHVGVRKARAHCYFQLSALPVISRLQGVVLYLHRHLQQYTCISHEHDDLSTTVAPCCSSLTHIPSKPMQ